MVIKIMEWAFWRCTGVVMKELGGYLTKKTVWIFDFAMFLICLTG